jgi:CRP-like cAMP-binding protein
MTNNFVSFLKKEAGITDEQILLLENQIPEAREYPQGAFLVRKGEVGKNIFYVEKGLLRFYDINEADGKEHIIQFAPENTILTSRDSTCFNDPSRYFIDALEDTVVVMLNQRFIDFASEVSAQFRMFNERIIQTNIHILEKRVNMLIGATAEDRYRDFLKTQNDLTQRIPQWMIASYLGITPESLSRIRKKMYH